MMNRHRFLTEREREVLWLMMQGYSCEGIAKQMFVTPATTRSHIRSILAKLGCRSQLEAVAMTYAQMWPEDPRPLFEQVVA
jgi:DNA-binding CsgD family transcriptional regulator